MKTARTPGGWSRLLLPMALALGTSGVGQSQSSDEASFEDRLRRYERFLNLHPLVRGGHVVPYWAPDGNTFWYADPEGDEGWLVDPVAGTQVRDGRPADVVSNPTPRPQFGPRLGRAWNEDGELWAEAEEDGLRIGGRSVTARTLVEPVTEVVWQLEEDAWRGPWLSAVRHDLTSVYQLELPEYSSAMPRLTAMPYAKAGDAAPVREAYLINVESGARLVVETGLVDPYVFACGWMGSEALILALGRDAKELRLIGCDPETKSTRLIHSEERDTFVGGLDFILGGWRDRVAILPDENGFLWLSDQDDWLHVYLHGVDGERTGRLTTGAFPVERILAIAAGRVWFLAGSEGHPYDRQLWSVMLDGTDQRQLTSAPGIHEVSFAPSMEFFLDTHSALDRPVVTELRRGSDGSLLRELSRANTEGLQRLGWIAPEPFAVLADDGETTLYGVLYRPAGFDPDRSYPVIDYIYAGPWLSVVQRAFFATGMAERAHALAQMGYVVFMLDARGTPRRSKSFQDATYGRIGELEVADHVAALSQLAERHAFLDTERAGIVGGSWGGYFVLRALFTAPDVFTAGVSIAPGDLTEAQPINEPYMGLPEQNPEGYRRGSVLFGARNLRGALLIGHGTADRNAPISTTMRVVAELVRHQKPHRTIILPDQGHSFSGASASFFRTSMLRFLEEHLRP